MNIDINNKYLCIIGLKVENTNEFYAIYQNRVFDYERAKKIVKKLRIENLDYRIYRIVDLIEVF